MITKIVFFVCLLLLPTQGWGAIAYEAAGSGQAEDTSPTTAAVTITQCAGCLVVACAVQTATGEAAMSIADSGTESFNTLIAAHDNFVRLQAWYAYNVSAGSNTITLTKSSNGSAILQILSFSGVTTTDPLDAAIGGPTNNSFASSWASAATGVRAQADEVLVSCLGNSVFGSGTYWSAGTTGVTYTEAFESTTSRAMSEYSIVSATTTYTGNATAGDGTNGGSIFVAGFKAAGASATAPSRMLLGVGK